MGQPNSPQPGHPQEHEGPNLAGSHRHLGKKCRRGLVLGISVAADIRYSRAGQKACFLVVSRSTREILESLYLKMFMFQIGLMP